jgi:hypothetical protein
VRTKASLLLTECRALLGPSCVGTLTVNGPAPKTLLFKNYRLSYSGMQLTSIKLTNVKTAGVPVLPS